MKTSHVKPVLEMMEFTFQKMTNRFKLFLSQSLLPMKKIPTSLSFFTGAYAIIRQDCFNGIRS